MKTERGSKKQSNFFVDFQKELMKPTWENLHWLMLNQRTCKKKRRKKKLSVIYFYDRKWWVCIHDDGGFRGGKKQKEKLIKKQKRYRQRQKSGEKNLHQKISSIWVSFLFFSRFGSDLERRNEEVRTSLSAIYNAGQTSV